MAIKPAGLFQLKYYRDFLESCTQTSPLETEASTSALFLASQPLFQNPFFEEQGITLSVQPPTLISTSPFAWPSSPSPFPWGRRTWYRQNKEWFLSLNPTLTPSRGMPIFDVNASLSSLTFSCWTVPPQEPERSLNTSMELVRPVLRGLSGTQRQNSGYDFFWRPPSFFTSNRDKRPCKSRNFELQDLP